MGIFDVFKQIESAQPAVTGAPEWIVAGLGNYEPKYENTRHNAGFIMADAFANNLEARFSRHQFRSMMTTAMCGQTCVLLLKPETFMNSSGLAVTEAMRYYHIPAEKTVIVYDDITLPVGGLRIRKQGSDGGHNGMKNIIYLSGTDQFPRVRVGIGQKPHLEYPLADWVLSAFSQDERRVLDETAGRVTEALKLILAGQIDKAMNQYNSTGKGSAQ